MENIDNLNNLELGAIYSYSELCLLLGEKEEAGNSRKAQFTRWNSYITFEKVGRKLKVVAVFQSRLLSADNFKAGGEHITNSGYLLMEYFLENKDILAEQAENMPNIYNITLFAREIAEICGFLPESYAKYKQGLLEGSLQIPTSSLMQVMFGEVVNGIVSDLVKSTISSLSKKKVFNLATVHIGLCEGTKSLRELSFDEVTKYEAIKLLYRKNKYKDKKIKLNGEDYNSLEKEFTEQLGVSKVYTAYKLGFSSEVLTKFLLEQEESMAKVANNGMCKGKVRTKIGAMKDKLDEDNKIRKANIAKGIIDVDKRYVEDLYFRNRKFPEGAVEEFNRLIDRYITVEE